MCLDTKQMNLFVGCMIVTIRCAAGEYYGGWGSMTPDAFMDFEFWDGCLMMCVCVCLRATRKQKCKVSCKY